MTELIGLSLIVLLTGDAGLALQRLVHPGGYSDLSEPQKIPFLGGGSPRTHAWQRYHVRYYSMTLLFIAFEMEMMFMYPWAVVYVAKGTMALMEMGMLGLPQALEHQIAAVGAKAVPAQSGQRQRMGGIVGEIEPALGVQRLVPRILQSAPARAQQPQKLGLRGGLSFQSADSGQVFQCLSGHWAGFLAVAVFPRRTRAAGKSCRRATAAETPWWCRGWG